jgi:hypothetical protein
VGDVAVVQGEEAPAAVTPPPASPPGFDLLPFFWASFPYPDSLVRPHFADLCARYQMPLETFQLPLAFQELLPLEQCCALELLSQLPVEVLRPMLLQGAVDWPCVPQTVLDGCTPGLILRVMGWLRGMLVGGSGASGTA